jgi:histidinol-phosphate/aromatic aminotransferase/cobyric acid decarboxylase-like protein
VLFVLACLGDTALSVKEHAMLVVEEKTFTSPIPKLVRFFRRSRDAWKVKCCTAKVALKRVKNEVYALRKSRDEWKELARQQEQELKQLRRELEEQKLTIG